MHCEMTVDNATPATSMCSGTTNSRLSAMFRMPAKNRKYSGRRVSPIERSTELPKLNSMMAGMPAK